METKTLFWLQSGGCSGDSMSILNMDEPDLFTQFKHMGIEVLWHPSLSCLSPMEQDQLIEKILSGEQKLDYFCLEGNVALGPNNSGMFDTYRGEPKKDLIAQLAAKAEYILAIGTCATFGGMGSHANDEMQGVGLQFHHNEKGGFLGKNFRSASDFPIINLSGCPIHPKALELTLNLLIRGLPLELDDLNRPKVYYGISVHNGCTRNVSHEFKLEDTKLGEDGCLFFNIGCKGPTTRASCNKYLWNEQSSKTRAGVPCFGCTRPDFPMPEPFYVTEKIAGTPIELPEGIDRAAYLAYKDMAAAAAPDYLRKAHHEKTQND
ncbi:MAG: hypothetical protein Q9M92_06000 [Enterobacterales bacterium]|nr:hypothetical protein [Enterobacterales bacterium]